MTERAQGVMVSAMNPIAKNRIISDLRLQSGELIITDDNSIKNLIDMCGVGVMQSPESGVVNEISIWTNLGNGTGVYLGFSKDNESSSCRFRTIRLASETRQKMEAYTDANGVITKLDTVQIRNSVIYLGGEGPSGGMVKLEVNFDPLKAYYSVQGEHNTVYHPF